MRDARTRWGAAAVGLLMLTATACGGAATPTTEPAAAAPYAGEPVTVEFWGSKPTLKVLAEEYNKRGGPITVKFVEQAGAVDLNKNLRNAHTAGGGPCVFDTITEDLNSLASDGIVADLSTAVAAWKGDYAPVAWEAVQSGTQTFALPAASIPTFMLYNASTFQKAGLAYPKTWEEFVAAGKVLKQQGVSIFNLAGEDYTTFVNLAWQAGAQWWALDGDRWKVNVDSPQTAKAADIMQQMIDADIVTKISYAEYSAMMQQYDAGTIASRQLSTWQTQGMQSKLSAGLGQWEPAPNLQLAGEAPANTAFTRAFAISSTCKSVAAAVEFAHWASTDPAVLAINADPVKGSAWFPAAAKSAQYVPLSQPKALLGSHVDKWQSVVDGAVATQKGDWDFGPNSSAAFKVVADLWGKAVAKQIKVADIAPQVQKWIVDDLTRAGIAVAS